MRKNLVIPMVVYEMLVEVSNKCKKKPEKWIEDLVKEHYKKV